MKCFITDKLVMSFWQYSSFKGRDMQESVQTWKEAGFNIGFSFKYHVDDTCKDKMIELLDYCHESGMKLIMFDDRLHCHRLREMSEDDYRKEVQRSVEEFGRHPAAAAFFVCDEPTKDTLPLAKKAVRIIGEISPIPAMVNFFPMWRSKDYVDLMGVMGADIEELYSDFAKDSGLQCMAYDCYGCMNVREPETDMEIYFDNLNTYYRTAQKAGIPLWTSLLCTGHWHFKQPNLSDMRWQVSTALAHGVKGIQWFMLYDNEDALGDSPIDVYNEKQPSYYDLKKVNQEYMAQLGDIIPKLELEEVYHYGNAYGRTQLYTRCDEYLKDFVAKYHDFALISRFKHVETGRIWYMFVNGSREAGNFFSYTFGEPYAHLNGGRWLSPGKCCLVELKERGK